jgi:hypothetical protein
LLPAGVIVEVELKGYNSSMTPVGNNIGGRYKKL